MLINLGLCNPKKTPFEKEIVIISYRYTAYFVFGETDATLFDQII